MWSNTHRHTYIYSYIQTHVRAHYIFILIHVLYICRHCPHRRCCPYRVLILHIHIERVDDGMSSAKLNKMTLPREKSLVTGFFIPFLWINFPFSEKTEIPRGFSRIICIDVMQTNGINILVKDDICRNPLQFEMVGPFLIDLNRFFN